MAVRRKINWQATPGFLSLPDDSLASDSLGSLEGLDLNALDPCAWTSMVLDIFACGRVDKVVAGDELAPVAIQERARSTNSSATAPRSTCPSARATWSPVRFVDSRPPQPGPSSTRGSAADSQVMRDILDRFCTLKCGERVRRRRFRPIPRSDPPRRRTIATFPSSGVPNH